MFAQEIKAWMACSVPKNTFNIVACKQKRLLLLKYIPRKCDELRNDPLGSPNSSESLLRLRSNKTLRLAISNTWGSNQCLLRFMPFRSLKAVVEGRIDLGDFQGLQVETLDLCACETLVMNDHVDLPLLRRVIIRPGQIDPIELRNLIRSNERFEITDTP